MARLPDPSMKVARDRTALVVTALQNDFLSPEGATWRLVGESVTENNTVANMETSFKAVRDPTCVKC